MRHIVKREGHEEHYESQKVFYTCYAACLNGSNSDAEAQKICKKVSKSVDSWIADKKHVTSNDIFKKVIELLRVENDKAAFMYETHRDIF